MAGDATSNKKKQWVLLAFGFGVLTVVVAALLATTETYQASSAPPVAAEKAMELTTPASAINNEEVWIRRATGQLETLRKAQNDVGQRNERLEKEIADLKKKLSEKNSPASVAPTTAEFPPTFPFNRPDSPFAAPPPAGTRPVQRGGAAQTPETPPPPRSSGVFVIDLGDADGAVEGGKQTLVAGKPKKEIDSWAPSGGMAKAVLLSGLDAPTGTGVQNPHPVVLKLLDDMIIPNGQVKPAKECFAVAAGYGDLASERAYLRTEGMSCTMEDGSIIDEQITGFIAGEDGKAGVRGRLVDKQGQLIARSFLAGLGSGLGKGISESFTTVNQTALGTTQTVDPNKILERGAYTGVATSLEKIADFYLDMAQKTFPIVEIAAGRTVTVVIQKGTYFGPRMFNQQSIQQISASGAAGGTK